ncbi:MAG: HAMP domain-containing sensor histidine kinase [Propionibacteriaceae bacterium]|nr:HAMP domain-containing sensor histidine kinase [Propionibacteriaceae bacterium]
MRATSLAAQLRRRVTAVVAALAVLISAGTIVSAGVILYSQLDVQLDNARTLQFKEPGAQDKRPKGITVPGMPPGTVTVMKVPDDLVLAAKIGYGEYDAVSDEAISTLLAVPTNGQKHTIDIPGWGQYRALAQHNHEGALVVIALPLDNLNTTMVQLTLLALGLGIVAVIVAAFTTRAAANAATKPLRSLSATASTISELDLDRGEVNVPAVPDPNLHPDHEVAKLTHAFNRMLGNVQGAFAARQASETKLRQFVADASHELRNPLAAIRGYSELAARGQGQDATFALGRIDAESRRMTKLVEDLLLLARLDADVPPQLGPVDIVEVVLNAVSDSRIAGPDHIWRLELPEEGFEVIANADRLHQVIVNLLSNARNHTPPGTTVTTSVAVVAGQTRLTVLDDGPGIAPEVLPQVFERFTRADTSRRHNETKSTGLGLSIVRAVVESFGGSATVTSRPGHTCFTITLPLAT